MSNAEGQFIEAYNEAHASVTDAMRTLDKVANNHNWIIDAEPSDDALRKFSREFPVPSINDFEPDSTVITSKEAEMASLRAMEEEALEAKNQAGKEVKRLSSSLRSKEDYLKRIKRRQEALSSSRNKQSRRTEDRIREIEERYEAPNQALAEQITEKSKKLSDTSSVEEPILGVGCGGLIITVFGGYLAGSVLGYLLTMILNSFLLSETAAYYVSRSLNMFSGIIGIFIVFLIMRPRKKRALEARRQRRDAKLRSEIENLQGAINANREQMNSEISQIRKQASEPMASINSEIEQENQKYLNTLNEINELKTALSSAQAQNNEYAILTDQYKTQIHALEAEINQEKKDQQLRYLQSLTPVFLEARQSARNEFEAEKEKATERLLEAEAALETAKSGLENDRAHIISVLTGILDFGAKLLQVNFAGSLDEYIASQKAASARRAKTKKGGRSRSRVTKPRATASRTRGSRVPSPQTHHQNDNPHSKGQTAKQTTSRSQGTLPKRKVPSGSPRSQIGGSSQNERTTPITKKPANGHSSRSGMPPSLNRKRPSGPPRQ